MTTPAPARAQAAARQSAKGELRNLIPSPSKDGSPVIPFMIIFTGAYLAWFGVHYWRDTTTIWPSDPVKDILRGTGLPAPTRQQSIASQVAQADPAAGYNPAVTGRAIADDARRYAGRVKYRWGHASPSAGWDCSGAANYILCHDMKLSIPGFQGGTFTGTTHGPNVAAYLAWDGAEHILTGTVQPGDLLCWGPNEHMGIAVSATEMLSAEDPAQGTQISSIAGFFVLPPIVLRIRELAAYAAAGGGTATANQDTAKLLAQPYGWSPSQDPGQWAALVALWDRESGWKTTATNPASGAYGIPQALPASKMAAAGAAWKTSARIQILWGLSYIKARYGTPEAAWEHEQAAGWY